MNIVINCKKCNHANTIKVENFTELKIKPFYNKIIGFHCVSCKEINKFKIEANNGKS